MGIRSSVRLWASFVALVAVGVPVAAAPQAGDKSVSAQQRKGSGLPIPRFASLRSDEVNVRTGPGSVSATPTQRTAWSAGSLTRHAAAQPYSPSPEMA